MRAEICAPCCAQEREVTLDCPFECEHLRDARRHEKTPEPDPASLPSPDIDLNDRFLQEHQPLIVVAGRLLLVAAMDTEGAVDNDMREALDALVRTYRTAESGLIYETRPNNVVAARIQARFQDEIAAFRERIAERSGTHSVRDRDLLGALVFWQRMEWQHNNGKRKGRAFIENLLGLLPPSAVQPPGEQPGRIIVAP
ncbi:MAG: hypothetical protein HXY18_04345 [Bryobacteraceae bacterium]|nr:hypothetical protein [Bryobacteraceae bacterium]